MKFNQSSNINYLPNAYCTTMILKVMLYKVQVYKVELKKNSKFLKVLNLTKADVITPYPVL